MDTWLDVLKVALIFAPIVMVLISVAIFNQDGR